MNLNLEVSLVIYSYDDYLQNIKNVLDSFDTIINSVYIMCIDNPQDNAQDNLVNYPIPITYINLLDHDYNINKCFNYLSSQYSRSNRIWILWRPYFVFNESKSDDFKMLINEISIGNYNMIYVYGLNLLIDIHHTNNASRYICRNGGCLIADRKVRLIENDNLYIVNKNKNKIKICYNIHDEHNTEYYFFNFAKAFHNSYMLKDIFENLYLKSIKAKFESFSDWYEKKGQSVICGKKYVENRLIQSSQDDMIFHNINLTPALQSLDLYIFDGISRILKTNVDNNLKRSISFNSFKNSDSSISSNISNISKKSKGSNISNIVNTNFHDYSMTIITLVRNNIHYLRESMKSLINQTSNKWNCVIVNDGSTDSVTIADFIDSTDKSKMKFADKFKIINLSEWIGLVKCHKMALLHATNDIIGILDADDELDLTAVQEVLNVYNKTQEDNIYVYTNFYYCDMDMKKTRCGYSNYVRTCLLNDRCANPFRTFKLKHYYLTEGYDDDLQFGAEDQDILFKLEKICIPVFLDTPLYFYRNSVDNITTVTSLKKMSKWSLFIAILKNIKDRYLNNNFQLKIFSNTTPYETTKYYLYRKERAQYSTGIKLLSSGYTSNQSNQSNQSNKQNAIYHGELYSNNIYIMNVLDPLFKFDIQIISEFIHRYTSNVMNDTFDVIVNWDTKESKFFIDNSSNNNLKLTNFVKIHPNLYFDHIYIINLKKDVEKRERMKKIFDSLEMKYDFFNGVYGNDETYLKVFNKNKYHKTLKSPGAYGYTLSMINIFNDALKNRYKKILVCDDDIIFHKNFLNLFDKNIRNIPFDWKVLFFGMSGPWTHPFINQDFNQFTYQKSHIRDTFNCDGSYCVGYDILILKDLINVVNKFRHPFDTSIIKYMNLNPNINKYAFQPYLVIADTTKSDITTREEKISDNFEAYQFKYRQNMGLFDVNTMLSKPYNIVYRNPYPLVSIIIIIHDISTSNLDFNLNQRLLSIDHSLKSVLNQTYKNIEIVLIDNTVSKKYKSIFDKYENMKELKIIVNSNNLCHYEAKNIGVENSSGEVIGYHNIDDYAISTKIEKQIKLMTKHNLLMVGCNIIKAHISDIHYESDQDILNDVRQNICISNIDDSNHCCREYIDYSSMLIRKDMYGMYIDHHECIDKEFLECVIKNKILNNKLDNTSSNKLSNKLGDTLNNNVYQIVDELLVVSINPNR